MNEIPRFVAIRFYVGWAVWDNMKARVVDGIYASKRDALRLSKKANTDPGFAILYDREWYNKNELTRFDQR
jgi:hypothetical protein